MNSVSWVRQSPTSVPVRLMYPYAISDVILPDGAHGPWAIGVANAPFGGSSRFCRPSGSDAMSQRTLHSGRSVVTPPLTIQGFLSSMDQTTFANGVEEVRLLPSYDDEHGGVIVDMAEPMDPNDFCAVLRCSLSQWKLQGKKGVWIKLPIELVNLVETAVKEGFLYHHAEPQYLMLVYWIPETLSTIPANATHRLRIGAIIMNEKRELLVVQEKHGRYKGMGIWKIPTGVVEEGEDIFSGAKREVKEETGIDAEFIDVLAFRQTHRCFFSKSDLFFLCMLRPISFKIQKQDSEIEAAQWMPITEYAAQPIVERQSIFKYVADVCLARTDKGYRGFTPVPISSSVKSNEISYLYINKDGLN